MNLISRRFELKNYSIFVIPEESRQFRFLRNDNIMFY